MALPPLGSLDWSERLLLLRLLRVLPRRLLEELQDAGAELVGPLPAEIQLITSFATAVGTNATQSEPAKALIKFLTTPATASVLKAKGLDPAG